MKKNNKGFSLVELIVVVLIMAIIAVALAPQVMKWVENSRKSTDCNNYDSVVSAVNIALANEDVMKEISKGEVQIVWANSSTATVSATGEGWSVKKASTVTSTTNLENQIAATLGSTWNTDLKLKRTTDIVGLYSITINSNGTVVRTNAPSANVS